MAIISLDQDRPISYLLSDMNLADNDTIQLAGHNLIIDVVTCGSVDDNVPATANIGVNIANNGGNVHIEFKDWSGLRLNNSLPNNVSIYTDSEDLIPECFTGESTNWPYSDDPYRTNLTANARVELQLNYDDSHPEGLGGRKPTLPTTVRSGNNYALVESVSQDKTQLTFDRELNIHVGDRVYLAGSFDNNVGLVTAYDPSTLTATFEDSFKTTMVGVPCWVIAGGICINSLSSLRNIITTDIEFGQLMIVSNYIFGFNAFASDTSVKGRRLLGCSCISGYQYDNVNVSQGGVLDIDEMYVWYLTGYDNEMSYPIYGRIGLFVGNMLLGAKNITTNLTCRYYMLNIENCITIRELPLYVYSGIISIEDNFMQEQLLSNKDTALLSAAILGNNLYESSGTITNLYNNPLYTPVSSNSIVWYYTDYTVKSNQYLQVRCTWQRRESDGNNVNPTNTLANVALTDTSVWWPQLWQSGGSSLAQVDFTSESSGSQVQLLKWRNTTGRDMQVRIWNCVTGSTTGGYLKAELAKGGPV